MFKTCQYEGYLRQFTKYNHMNKKIIKGRHEWERACVERGLQLQKLRTLMKTKFVNKVIIV